MATRTMAELINTASNQLTLLICMRVWRLFASMEDIADISNRVDHHREPTVQADLAAQLPDMHVDHVGLRVEMVIPYRLEQHGPRDRLTGVTHHIFKQLILARLQVD